MARRLRGAPNGAPTREQSDARLLDVLLRLEAVAADPAGDAVWLLLDPPRVTNDGETIH